MRIIKKDKEKVDVKKFMDEMKATRTNRSYTSLEPKHRPTEGPEPRHYVPKYALQEAEFYHPPYPQSLRYGMEAARYPPYNSYAARTMTEMAPSQHFTASPPYQQHSMMNYSQSFNSQAYPMMHQQSASYEQPYGEMLPVGYPQSRGAGSKMSIVSTNNPPPQQSRMLEHA